MSSAAETGFISIFIQFVTVSMLTVRSVIFNICDIAVMRIKFISCDKDE